MRILVTGLGTFWGSRLARHLEQVDGIDVIVGLDTREPRLPLERTEFVRADSSYSILSRIVRATKIDTILHTHLVVDSTRGGGKRLHEINVIGTLNLLAAAGAAGSTVRKVVVKSSTLVYGANAEDPYFFREHVARSRSARTPVERSLLEVESYLHDFAEDNPHVDVTLLRFANVLGDHIETPFTRALRLPLVPEVLGFDPRLQFTHEDDVIGSIVFTAVEDVPGIYNVAGDGVLPLERGLHDHEQATGGAPPGPHPHGGHAAAMAGRGAAGRDARRAAPRAGRRQLALQAGRLRPAVHVGSDGRGVRPPHAPRARDRRGPAHLPLRA
ncbi:MAG: NAD-dependent epimerase/dehydratase family protein [Acidimicrobiia bacterium]|nr:NAD-dependent epimerase/dehydratase family protein [Acidimicrobiia bacterium]